VLKSFGIIVISVIIYFTNGLGILDPIYTFLLSILVIYSTKSLAIDTFNVLIEATPKGIHVGQFREKILTIEGITDIHDLHVWPLKEGKPAMMAHLISESGDKNK